MCCVARALTPLMLAAVLGIGIFSTCPLHAQVRLPPVENETPITVAADTSQVWKEGEYDVYLLKGNFLLRQGLRYVRCDEAVLWVLPGDGFEGKPTKIIAYLEGKVSIVDRPIDVNRDQGGRLSDSTWDGEFSSMRQPTFHIKKRLPVARKKTALYHRAVARQFPMQDRLLRRAQFTAIDDRQPLNQSAPSTRSVRVDPRSSLEPSLKWFPSQDKKQWIAVIRSGVILTVNDSDGEKIDIATDRAVIWTTGTEMPDLSGTSAQSKETPLELYLEGNIVFRQGDRIVYANRMYYNVNNKTGTVIDAHILTPIEGFSGLVRLKADVVQQLDQDRFLAHNAAITSSRLGVPSYWFQSDTLSYQRIRQFELNPQTGEPSLDLMTGKPKIHERHMVNGTGNFLYIERFPIFYWPSLTTDMSNPEFYINQVRIKNDNIFGTQVFTDWDAYQLFGFDNPPEGTDLQLNLDYLSERGAAGGLEFTYDRNESHGSAHPYKGRTDLWVIHDGGFDDLGRDRRMLTFEDSFRGRWNWQHRHFLSNDYQLTAQFGWISDRNFLEQYFEYEWDEWKDQSTQIKLKQFNDDWTWSVRGGARINDFHTETEWLPRADITTIGRSFFMDRLVWSQHSSAGFARLRPANAPFDPIDAAASTPLAWEVPSSGERISTRHELTMPLSSGPVQIIPFVLGELTHWGEDLTGDDLQRAYGQVGVRANLPMWRLDPAVQSELFNLDGLAHKVNFEAELSLADANQDLGMLPLYDQLDDNSIEQFRRRFALTTFPGAIPMRFDERFYALRSGLGDSVTGPTEIADDLFALRMGVRQRWQTRRGAPGNVRIIDWITLDLRSTFFPKENRDNFGENIGLTSYDFRWNVGDRVTILSDGIYDSFAGGQKLFTIGTILNRPPNGSWYLGFRSLEGPISSNVVNTSFTYKISPKWIATFGSSFDLSSTGNIGQRLSVTRVGESMLVRAGVNIDSSRDSVGFHLAIEPRFWPKSRLSRSPGAQAPPAGPLVLE